MPIAFSCSHCGTGYRVSDTQSGKRFLCKGCGRRVQVPGETLHHRPGIPTHPLEGGEVSSVALNSLEPYGGVEIQQPRLMARRLNFVFIAAVMLTMVGMSTPWLHVSKSAPEPLREMLGGYVPGFQLPFVLNDGIRKQRAKAANHLRQRGFTEKNVKASLSLIDSGVQTYRYLYVLLAIPVVAALALAVEIRSAREGANRVLSRAANTFTPVLAFVVLWIAFADLVASPGNNGSGRSGGEDILSLGIGFWLVCLGGLVSFVSLFTSPSPAPVE